MSTLQTFFGPPAVTSVVGSAETASTSAPVAPTTAAWRGANNLSVTPTGVMTAATFKSIINVTGQGELFFAGLQTLDTTSRDLTLRVTLDGVAASTRQMTAVTLTGRLLLCVGAIDSAGGSSTTALSYGNVRFNKSLLIEARSSLSEAVNIADVLVNYVLN